MSGTCQILLDADAFMLAEFIAVIMSKHSDLAVLRMLGLV